MWGNIAKQLPNDGDDDDVDGEDDDGMDCESMISVELYLSCQI